MKIAKLILCLAWFDPTWLIAQDAQVTEILSKDLTNIPGKEGSMLIIGYPPGASDPARRHNAHVAGQSPDTAK
ncbi:putative exported protein [Acidisarcina polymorpha]|uniref:Putative exported protein n=1 Tax=Acidisarcina polymorpha TaxID=2211140 RepID=A0A2Z5FVF9_9BACT|nr:hypothetical protein [Acidisarcina polymorpha]AXC10730.1 putative exported protein [Acidisarcina polymorpha]